VTSHHHTTRGEVRASALTVMLTAFVFGSGDRYAYQTERNH
jgi:hypothetical protein